MLKEIILTRNFFRFSYRVLRWHVDYVMRRTASPLACGLYLTSHCNFRCGFCNICRISPGFTMPEPEAMNLVGELGKLGVVYFSVSGGEPLTVGYLFDLMARAKACGILYTHIVSNGFLMDREKGEKLAEADVSEISFSLDGDERTHDANRRTEGSYKKVIEAVGHVQGHAPRTKIVLNAILDPVEPESAVEVVKMAGKLGVKIKVQPLNRHPSLGLSDPVEKTRSEPSAAEKDRLVEIIDQLVDTPHVVNSKAFLLNYRAFLFDPKVLLPGGDCIFGYHHVEFFGNRLFPCLEGLDWDGGVEFSGRSLREVLRSEAYHRCLKGLRGCENCARNYYVCYYEPRLNFPVWNLARVGLKTAMAGGR